MIAFVGSVFSPYYARARKQGEADPANHCALNVALYAEGRPRKRWSMTERGRRWLRRSPAALEIGPSRLHWDGSALEARIDEIAVPRFSRIRGRIRLLPHALVPEPFELDPAGLHRWHPIAPRARVEVDLEQPALRWSGEAYLDSNHGDEPLEDGFVSWDWSRGAAGPERTAVLYDGRRRDGGDFGLSLLFDDSGRVEPFPAPPRHRLETTPIWRIPRATRSDTPGSARVTRTLEDTPFYSRSVLSAELLGASGVGVHESLCLDRFRSRWVQTLLPFRTPRRG